jgi:glycosyltransferase involved in cell wall biosynthesis
LDHATVIPNGVDTERFSPAESRAPGRPPNVLFVGRLNRVKGFDLVPAIVRGVLQREPSARFTFVGADREPQGDVPDEGARNSLAAELPAGSEDRVTFKGAVPQDDMANLYRQADVLLAPSRVETFSLVCAEAAACGVPVVGSRGTGIEAVVDDGVTGFLADTNDAASFTARVSELLANAAKAREMGQRGREKACRAFGLAATAQATVTVYETLG